MKAFSRRLSSHLSDSSRAIWLAKIPSIWSRTSLRGCTPASFRSSIFSIKRSFLTWIGSLCPPWFKEKATPLSSSRISERLIQPQSPPRSFRVSWLYFLASSSNSWPDSSSSIILLAVAHHTCLSFRERGQKPSHYRSEGKSSICWLAGPIL